ncbi:hypothetical protein [Sulfobacillus harzensis]|uniref:DUF3850 domain-containing protein n=1 Tax=Sulfobacillus harzensis TaxID=2729629 RepID=A0A7Y0L8T9_9FIRM|nr:hypothetical protein [Sulfobacillus harzensis]NMP24941.1 hypothetical protein [Sulfobacillus harzensis]
MVIACATDQFEPIDQGRRTATVIEEHGVQFTVGDRIRYEEIDDQGGPTGRVARVIVTDVFRADDQDRHPVLSIRRERDLTEIQTPGGTLTVAADASDFDAYPGFAVFIEDQLAAVVEWHVEERAFALRTYNDSDEEPQHYHRWDGTLVVKHSHPSAS